MMIARVEQEASLLSVHIKTFAIELSRDQTYLRQDDANGEAWRYYMHDDRGVQAIQLP